MLLGNTFTLAACCSGGNWTEFCSVVMALLITGIFNRDIKAPAAAVGRFMFKVAFPLIALLKFAGNNEGMR